MEFGEILGTISQYGALALLAGLFIWSYFQDKAKNSKLLEELNRQADESAKMTSALVESNQNIAKSLDIVAKTLSDVDKKADRNYEIIIRACEGHEKAL